MSSYRYRSNRAYSHFWTVGPYFRDLLVPDPAGPTTRWSGDVPDGVFGPTEGSGVIHHVEHSERLVVLVHGLGSTPDAGYIRRAAQRLMQRGFSVLRIALRGSDGVAADYYHAGWTADLHGALADPVFDRYTSRFIVGFSLGGHIALRFAMECRDPRLAAVAAVCPPLDLAQCQRALDSRTLNFYRASMLKGLRKAFKVVTSNAHREERYFPTIDVDLTRIKTIREWDERVVVPRFGFGDVDTYYHSVSAGPALDQLLCPSLIVAAEYDPVIPIETLERYLSGGHVDVRTSQHGGHVGFPLRLDLGLGAELGLIPQIATWLDGVTYVGSPNVISTANEAEMRCAYGPHAVHGHTPSQITKGQSSVPKLPAWSTAVTSAR